MNTTAITARDRHIHVAPRARRQGLAALSLLFGAVIVIASVYVYMSMLTPAAAAPGPPLLAGFGHRSYSPGQVATLQIDGGETASATLQVFLAGAAGGDAPVTAQPGYDASTHGEAVSAPTTVTRPSSGSPWTVNVPVSYTHLTLPTNREV